jgi:hypothetical protein
MSNIEGGSSSKALTSNGIAKSISEEKNPEIFSTAVSK